MQSMKNLFALLAFLLCVCFVSAQDIPVLIPEDEVAPTPIGEIVAKSTEEAINKFQLHAIQTHKVLWETTWENPRGATPQQVFDGHGVKGGRVLFAGSEMVKLINNIAQFLQVPITKLLPIKYLGAPYEYTIANDGRVTVDMSKPVTPQIP